MISWFKSWFVGARVSRHVAALNRKLDREHAKCEAYLARLREVQSDMESRMTEFQHLAREMERAQRQYEAAIDMARIEKDSLEHGIESVVAINKTIVSRYHADMAVSERRKVAASIREE